MTDLSPDELQIAFHDVECATYDERFGIAYDDRTARDVVWELTRLVDREELGRVLDVGCGTGYLGLSMGAAGAVDEIHASDISPGMLERAVANAEELGVDARFVRASATDLPYPDDTFDAVVSRGVLHHLHDPVASLAEWRRVVRPGGPVVALSEPTPLADRIGGAVARTALRGLGPARRVAAAVGRPLSSHDEEEAERHRYWDLVALVANLHTFTPDELRYLGRDAGYGRVEVRGSGWTSIAWASAYYVLAGELPGLASSDTAKRRAGVAWSALRRLDATVVEPLLPDRALMTVQAVFRG